MSVVEYSRKMGSSAVALVHDQLEVLKYVGGFVPDPRDESKFQESGEGLVMSILTLPDVVLDFHRDNLESGTPVDLPPGKCASEG